MATATTEPILFVSFEATCEVTGSTARGTSYRGCGLVLDAASGLCVAVGNSARMAIFPAFSVQRVHTKFLGSGKVTFEINAGAQGMKNILVSKATGEELKTMLMTLDAAAKAAKQRNARQATQEEVIALLQQRYPQEVKKQLAKLREKQGVDSSPQPQAKHTRLMLVVDANGSSVMQAGRSLCKLAEAELKLTSHQRPGESNGQNFKAVCKDPTDRSPQIELRVRQAMHHRWPAGALWLDFELGEKVAVAAFRACVVKAFAQGDEQHCFVTQLAHGAIKERLASNLVLHIRSGLIEQGANFGTRLELRWGELDPSAKPLGKCELRYWEESTRMAAPVVTAFEMLAEPCKAWGSANGDKGTNVLAASLIARLEVFCLRLAASSTGHASRTRLLVLGWLPEVKMAASFQKRGFTFQGDPSKSLGFKMLKNEEAKRKDAAATGSPAADASGAASSSAPAVEGVIGGGLPPNVQPGAAAGAASAGAGAAAAESSETAAAAPLAPEGKPAQGDTPGLATGLGGAATKRRRPDDNLTPQPAADGGLDEPGGDGAGGGGEGAGPAEAEPSPPKPEAIDLGEIGMLGRAPKAAKPEGAAAEPAEYVPVSISASLARDLGVDASGSADPTLLGGEGDGDELDATMAELLGQ